MAFTQGGYFGGGEAGSPAEALGDAGLEGWREFFEVRAMDEESLVGLNGGVDV